MAAQQTNVAPAAAPASSVARAPSIECVINGEFSVACLRQDDDVYVPFNFIRRYFEVSFSQLRSCHAVKLLTAERRS